MACLLSDVRLAASGVRVGAARGGSLGAETAARHPGGMCPSVSGSAVRERRQKAGQVRADGRSGAAEMRRHAHRR